MSLLTIAATRTALAQGQLRPTKLVRGLLDRIGRDDGRLRAWALVDAAGALAQAATIEAAIAAGEALGPLVGIPIGIKDIFDVEGLPTRAGSPLTSAEPAAADAPVVARLRRAGAIILGKTVTTEFACFDPSATRNPWNLAHTPGGSSSGSAAAVAAGMCLAAIGSQTGGSIVRPAAYCGVCGFKPSFGTIDRAGMAPVSAHLDHVGPLARGVDDLRILWEVMCDPGVNRTPTSIASGAPRLGVVETFLHEAEPEVARIVEQAIALLRSRGAVLNKVSLVADFDLVRKQHRTIMAFDAADYHRRTYGAPRPGCGPNMAALLSEGAQIPAAKYQAAVEHQQFFRKQMAAAFTGFDAWLLPSTNTVAPGRLDTTGDPRFNSPWSYAGLPELTLPCGVTAAGMPVGLQLVGPANRDADLLTCAAGCERQIGFSAKPQE
jgi:Asp-tRNA(Asn)/Glu-tRNA(Gln) amidotransferase A subunit family amidase